MAATDRPPRHPSPIEAPPAERVNSALRRCSEATLTVQGMEPMAVALAHAWARGRLTVGVHGSIPRLTTILGRADRGIVAELHVNDAIVGRASGPTRQIVIVRGSGVVPSLHSQRTVAHCLVEELPHPDLLNLGEDFALMDLINPSVILVDDKGVTSVGLADLFDAPADPFSDIEGMWLAHFNDPRCPVVDQLSRRVGLRNLVARPDVIALDRTGITLRVRTASREQARSVLREVRLTFVEPCSTTTELGKQIRLLLGCPRGARRANATFSTKNEVSHHSSADQQ